MKLKTGNGKVMESDSGGRKVVVVGVKLERRSRELLTWTLMKIAQPGDLVIALHCSSGEQSSVLSLVKTFDYALAVYQGFCHLKQVELKLKVSKGSSVRKTLIEEAKLHHGATVIVGVSINHHTILLPTSIAKHCAKKLSNTFSVVAVHNGKIVFHRKATASDAGICRNTASSGNYFALSDVIIKGVESYMEITNSLNKHVSGSTSTMIKRYFGCGPSSKWSNLHQMPPKPCTDPIKKQEENQLSNLSSKELDRFNAMCTLFKYKELLSATSGFLPGRMIGRGGSSCVFKGRICDGKEVAVKILKSSSKEVLKEFIAEVEIVTSISHKNIISLLGFCIDYETPILVYNLLPRGSLEQNLHGHKKNVTAFGWEERYKVALGVAKALNHLHNGISKPVIHRDVKSSNILLAQDFEPQLADFGLATWASTASFATCTDVAGTFGYLAPEYFMQGKVTEKIDVYAFGVVLLELLSGRKPIDNKNPLGHKSLVMWANPILKGGKISELVDARLGSHDNQVTERMSLAATLCIRRAPLHRPRISIVLKILQGDPKVTKWAKQQINMLDGEASSNDLQSHLNTAFLDLQDDTSFTSRTESSVVVQDYLKGRWSRFPT